MPGTIQLVGELLATPGCSGSFPAGITTITLGVNPCTGKPYTNATGDMQVTVNASTYETLQGIGTGGVAAANVLYMRSVSPMQVRLTLADASQPVLFPSGTLLFEAQAGKEVTKVEVIGSGNLEYFAAGAS